MLTIENREKMRRLLNIGRKPSINTAYELLDALDEAEEVSENAVRWCNELEADRDRWKARAIRAESDYEKARNHATDLTRRVEALERALIKHTGCATCKRGDDRFDDPCLEDCKNYSRFKFDQARFASEAAGGAE